MIYMRSKLDDNLTWVLGVHIWHSEGAINEKYWFGLHRGCATSTWPKLKCTPQNFPACKISGHFIHWGPFYGTPLSENLDFAPPFWKIVNCHPDPVGLNWTILNALFIETSGGQFTKSAIWLVTRKFISDIATTVLTKFAINDKIGQGHGCTILLQLLLLLLQIPSNCKFTS